MEDKMKFEDFFGAKIDPGTEDFVRQVILFCLHENHYILLEPMDIEEQVQSVGNTIRIYRHVCKDLISQIINQVYPDGEQLTLESHKNILFHFFLWFYSQKDLISNKQIFPIVAALAMEVIYTLWKNPELSEEFIKSTLYILASVFSGREFKRYLMIDGFKNYAEFYEKKRLEDFRSVENQYVRHKDDDRKKVSMNYLARDASDSGEGLSSISEEIQNSITVYAEKSPLFVELLEKCNTKEMENVAQSQPDEHTGIEKITEDVKVFISQFREFIARGCKSPNLERLSAR